LSEAVTVCRESWIQAEVLHSITARDRYPATAGQSPVLHTLA
jgi:hypothetical protein